MSPLVALTLFSNSKRTFWPSKALLISEFPRQSAFTFVRTPLGQILTLSSLLKVPREILPAKPRKSGGCRIFNCTGITNSSFVLSIYGSIDSSFARNVGPLYQLICVEDLTTLSPFNADKGIKLTSSKFISAEKFVNSEQIVLKIFSE